MHEVIPPAALYGYNTGAGVMTLVLPLGFFIVVMIALYFVFTRPHTVPGLRPISGAKPVAPDPQTARDMTTAAGFSTAPSGGAAPPLADRATPPVVGARAEPIADVAPEDASDEAAFGGGTPADTTSDADTSSGTESSEDPE